jgi:carbon-monoxide dehydrogenase large subunit
MSREHGGEGYVGQAVRAIKDDAFVAGQARYTSDYVFPGQLHVHLVRSPHAAARILKVDTANALKISGVVKVLTGEEAATLLAPIPHYIDPAVFGGRTTPIRALA